MKPNPGMRPVRDWDTSHFSTFQPPDHRDNPTYALEKCVDLQGIDPPVSPEAKG
jgi:hypothetical protein